jgi:hypothetical protein
VPHRGRPAGVCRRRLRDAGLNIAGRLLLPADRFGKPSLERQPGPTGVCLPGVETGSFASCG